MSKIVFANRDYGPAGNGWGAHLTDEGLQIQLGLECSGWTLTGAGYGDGNRDALALIDRHRPEAIFVQDRRDWDPQSPGAFRKDIGFKRLEQLVKFPEISKVCVVKDAGSLQGYHAEFCQQIAADGVVVYYHPQSVLAVSPFLKNYHLIRTYHTVDRMLAQSIDLKRPRKRALVSGAVSRVYPLRQLAVQHARSLGLEVLAHPGYGNSGVKTPYYLKTLSGYRVHLACSSDYGFALRKLIESVAMGCTPVTDLPHFDVLPEIDSALVRVKPGGTLIDLRLALEKADAEWNLEERLDYAAKAQKFYDYRAIGQMTNAAIEALKVAA